MIVEVDENGNLIRANNEQSISISPAAFTVEADNDSFRKILGQGHAYVLSGVGGLSAPVYLPHGAKVTRVKISFIDNSTQDLTFRLRRSPHTSVVMKIFQPLPQVRRLQEYKH